MRRSIPTALFIMGLAGAGVAGACSSSPQSSVKPKGNGPEGGVCFSCNHPPPADGGMGSSVNGISITPAQVAVTVNPADGPPPSTQFVVHGAEAGTVGFHSSNPTGGTVDSNGLFPPTGQAGGVVRVEATVGTTTVYATV